MNVGQRGESVDSAASLLGSDYGYVSLHGWHGCQWADFTLQQLGKEVELSQSNEMKKIMWTQLLSRVS